MRSIRLSCLGRETVTGYADIARGATLLHVMQEERREIRCAHCGKLLAKGQATSLEFKCPRCGAYTIVRAERPDREPQDGHSRSNLC